MPINTNHPMALVEKRVATQHKYFSSITELESYINDNFYTPDLVQVYDLADNLFLLVWEGE